MSSNGNIIVCHDNLQTIRPFKDPPLHSNLAKNQTTIMGYHHEGERVPFEMTQPTLSRIHKEEQLVAELEQLGVRYLSRMTNEKASRLRTPRRLLVDLVQQPSSRVRAAVIALLLARPAYGKHVPAAVKGLAPEQALTLKLFYTAAVLLQREYAAPMQNHLGAGWLWLTDYFSAELNLPETAPEVQLRELAKLHRQKTGVTLNWAGTYENAARHLIRRWELEQIWNR